MKSQIGAAIAPTVCASCVVAGDTYYLPALDFSRAEMRLHPSDRLNWSWSVILLSVSGLLFSKKAHLCLFISLFCFRRMLHRRQLPSVGIHPRSLCLSALGLRGLSRVFSLISTHGSDGIWFLFANPEPLIFHCWFRLRCVDQKK